MSKHTPGPWTADLHNTRISGGRSYAMVLSKGSLVPVAGALLGVEGCSDEEGRANAILIAAAPDLLATLKKARAFVAEFGDQKMFNTVDSAITKAEGGTKTTAAQAQMAQTAGDRG